MSKVAQSGFADCCGLNMAFGFYPSATKENSKDYSGQIAYLSQAAYMNTVIVLTGCQQEDLKEHLDNHGWRCVHEFFNPNHSSVLYLYFRDVRPDKSPGNPKFRSDLYVVDRPYNTPSQGNSMYAKIAARPTPTPNKV